MAAAPEDKNVMWLEACGDGEYVSDLSRLFGEDCRTGINLENCLVVYRSHRIIATAALDDGDAVKSVTVDYLPAGMSRDEYFRTVETFIGRKVLYRQVR